MTTDMPEVSRKDAAKGGFKIIIKMGAKEAEKTAELGRSAQADIVNEAKKHSQEIQSP
jgi:hypothetical protein